MPGPSPVDRFAALEDPRQSWEADNRPIDATFAQSLKALSPQRDPINTRVQADRTPDPATGDRPYHVSSPRD